MNPNATRFYRDLQRRFGDRLISMLPFGSDRYIAHAGEGMYTGFGDVYPRTLDDYRALYQFCRDQEVPFELPTERIWQLLPRTNVLEQMLAATSGAFHA